jgi:hypothetical protein
MPQIMTIITRLPSSIDESRGYNLQLALETSYEIKLNAE